MNTVKKTHAKKMTRLDDILNIIIHPVPDINTVVKWNNCSLVFRPTSFQSGFKLCIVAARKE